MSMVDASQEIEWTTISGEVEARGDTAIRIPQSKGAIGLWAMPQFDLGEGIRMWTEQLRDETWMICFNLIPPNNGKISWLAVPAGLPTPEFGV